MTDILAQPLLNYYIQGCIGYKIVCVGFSASHWLKYLAYARLLGDSLANRTEL